jgi:hypothetical protein
MAREKLQEDMTQRVNSDFEATFYTWITHLKMKNNFSHALIQRCMLWDDLFEAYVEDDISKLNKCVMIIQNEKTNMMQRGYEEDKLSYNSVVQERGEGDNHEDEEINGYGNY